MAKGYDTGYKRKSGKMGVLYLKEECGNADKIINLEIVLTIS